MPAQKKVAISDPREKMLKRVKRDGYLLGTSWQKKKKKVKQPPPTRNTRRVIKKNELGGLRLRKMAKEVDKMGGGGGGINVIGSWH